MPRRATLSPDEPIRTSEPPRVFLSAAATEVPSGGRTTLTWSGTAVDGCSASGGWTGDRGASGTATVGPITEFTTYSLSCTGPGGSVVKMISVSAIGETTITWSPPTENTDGTRLTDLAGYRLYFGRASGNYTNVVEITDPTATSHVVNLRSGDFFFAMTAVDRERNESARSNEISRTMP